MNKKLQILRCGDTRFWAYHWIALEQAKYTDHNISYAKHDEVNLLNQDIIYINSPDIKPYHALDLPIEAKNRGIKVIGGYAGNPKYWSCANKLYSYADLIVTISPQTYSFAKYHYKDIPVIFMPECVDNNYFIKDRKKDNNSFIVGWAGGKHKPIKRFYLAEQLKYPVVTKDDWKLQRNSQDKQLTLEGMRDFYNSIDVLVITSESECCSRVALEAMSCGVPVISTNVGNMKMLLPGCFIVDSKTDDNIVAGINNILDYLKSISVSLNQSYGNINRVIVNELYSWESQKELWDKMFEDVYNGNIQATIDRSEEYLKLFGDNFTSELISDEEIKNY
jgi:glycosyltransferase involved in cell wall biosynthesis